MKKGPQIQPPELSGEQRVCLDEWLAQWRLDRHLRQQPDLDAPPKMRDRDSLSEQDLDRLIAPFSAEPTPEIGQVRLLAPSLLSEGRGPTYVAVLGHTGVGDFLVAPFSRFQTPATPHELLLRTSPPALAVLCPWNARPVSAFVLSQSWCVSQLAQDELGDALIVCGLTGRRDSVPTGLSGRVGPPVYDPADVRLDYMDEEGELWRNITAFPSEAESGEVVRLPTFRDVSADVAMQLAAESEDVFARIQVLELPQQQVLVHVFAMPRERTLFLVVTDPTGESSPGLDGTLVSLRGIGMAGQIGSGQCIIQADDPAEIALMDPSGAGLHVSKVDGPPSIRPFSYVRLVEMLGSDQDAVSVLTDSELRRLVQNRPHEPRLDANVTAEVYFRAWLYEGSSRDALCGELAGWRDPEIDRLLDGPLAAARTTHTWDGDAAVDARVHGRTRAIWNRLAGRIHSFTRADGIIPVITGESAEAIPIAFNLRANESPGTAIRDIRGISMPLWDEAEEIFGDLLAQHIGVQLQCSTRGTGRQFDGESFELPIALALARKQGSLPDYPPLSVMASGAIRGDTVEAVAGIDAKMDLARRMGVRVFVTPGVTDTDVVMGIPAGMTIQDVVHTLAVRLERAGLDRLDTRTAAARLNNLGDEIHMGTVSLPDTTERLNRYERVLERDTASRIATEGLIRARVLRGAIANHSGDPQAGVKATREAAELAAKARMPLLYVNAMASRIVSLTDLGHLAEAESEGRRLLEWVLREFSGASAEQLQAEMVACGVLGGQPLLQMALQGTERGPESLRLLERAFEIAKELRMSADICRDSVQIALWHALLDPARTETEVQKAHAVLEGHAGVWSTTSLAHLTRVRFLGAYRACLYHGIYVSGYAHWPLPEGSTPSLYWVRATTQKYRGVLFAKQGQAEAAEKNFGAACAILDRESATLLRFIGGTVALAAGEAMLGENRPSAVVYLQKAKAVFSLQADRLEGPVKGALWLQRTEGLLSGSPAQNLPDPQRFFPY